MSDECAGAPEIDGWSFILAVPSTLSKPPLVPDNTHSSVENARDSSRRQNMDISNNSLELMMLILQLLNITLSLSVLVKLT